MRVIAGTFKGNKLKTLAGDTTRPTSGRVREAVFSILHYQIVGTRWLDLCAGNGGVGIEALSRGAIDCTFVDKDSAACAIINYNLAYLGLEAKGKVLCKDAVSACKLLAGAGFDMVYIDPPYSEDQIYWRIGETVTHCLSGDGIVVVEHTSHIALNFPGLITLKTRRYGQTLITILGRANNGEGNLSR